MLRFSNKCQCVLSGQGHVSNDQVPYNFLSFINYTRPPWTLLLLNETFSCHGMCNIKCILEWKRMDSGTVQVLEVLIYISLTISYRFLIMYIAVMNPMLVHDPVDHLGTGMGTSCYPIVDWYLCVD